MMPRTIRAARIGEEVGQPLTIEPITWAPEAPTPTPAPAPVTTPEREPVPA